MSLSAEQRVSLESLVRAGGYDGSVSGRAEIVLLWADGVRVSEIVARTGATKPTVYKWVRRFGAEGVDGLVDRLRPGRPRRVPDAVRGRIVALSRASPPAETGLSHWSSRELARYLCRVEGIEVSHDFIVDLWRERGLAPHRQGTFTLSGDAAFAEKVADIVGLYLDPPDGAVVVSVDEKSQVQALDRTQPLLPMTFHKSEKRTHDYVRHGTTNLFAALEVGTGQVVSECFPRRRTAEFVAFMDTVASRYGDARLHVIVDNLSTHSGPAVAEWLAEHPNVTFHFTPTGSSWLNQVEIWFNIITRQSIRRGTFSSVRVLTDQIKAYVKHWNEDAAPFTWTATTKQILAKVRIIERDFKKLLANNQK